MRPAARRGGRPARPAGQPDQLAGLAARLGYLRRRTDRRRRIAGRPADFSEITPGPILGPQGGQNRIPRGKKYSDIFMIFRPIFENQNF